MVYAYRFDDILDANYTDGLPIELVAKGPNHEEFERVQVDSYKDGNVLREELRRKYKTKEVIYIFDKWIG